MVRTRRTVIGTGALMVTALLAGCSASSGDDAAPRAGAATSAAATPVTSATSVTPVTEVAPTTSTATAAVAGGAASTLPAQDIAAGLLSTTFPQSGSGRLQTVPGRVKAPGRGTVVRVKVQVESGLKVDRARFAAFVLDTLNDPRSWGHGGRRTFARTDGSYDVRVVLATPDTSAGLCRPLITRGKLSCGIGRTAVMTMYRWVRAIPDYGSNRTGYRHYLVNHEVGHTLGHHHEYCGGKGEIAPVMQQQTKRVKPCRPNPWPYP